METEEAAVKGEVEEEAERVVAIKGDVFAEEAEREVTVKGEVDVENAEREVATKEEVEAKEVEREVTVKGEVEVEDPETRGEVVSVDIGPEGKIVSEMTVMGRENVVNIVGEKVAEAEQMPESLAQEVALEGEGLTQEERMMNEPTIQDEVENPSEETEAERSIDLQMKEGIDLDETITEEQMIEGVISLQVVEEALLIGIQQLITDVSQLNVGVEDKEEELEMEGLAEDKSFYEDPMKEERLEHVVAKERKIAQGDEADQRGTEHGKEIHLERKDGRGNKKIEAGDYPVENLLWTETIPLSAQQFGIEQHHELSAQIINLEPAGMSDPKDEH
ncbi:hypothetical protein lerEdw1_011786 [Lerista edwardsae]|nr:hypothetical protein lerEdw1_011786 [Lerista edwardsae]